MRTSPFGGGRPRSVVSSSRSNEFTGNGSQGFARTPCVCPSVGCGSRRARGSPVHVTTRPRFAVQATQQATVAHGAGSDAVSAPLGASQAALASPGELVQCTLYI